jgi:hypothetical protein
MTVAAATGDNDPLSPRSQVRNMALYVASAAMAYTAAPILYVGILQASLCHSLGASDTVANLPYTAFFCALAAPLFITSRFQSVSSIRPMLVANYLITALAGLAVWGILYFPFSTLGRLVAITLHAACIGVTTGVIYVFLWGVVSRGIASRWRGLTFALAYGCGPMFAVAGSIVAQWILSGKLELSLTPALPSASSLTSDSQMLQFPQNFALLYAATSPLMLVGALCACFYVVPQNENGEPPRVRVLANLLQTNREVFSDPVLRRTVMAYLIVVAGSSVVTIMSLYTPQALGRPPEELAGYQTALKFAFKMTTGLVLAWLFARTHAKLGLIVPTGMCLCGVLWVLFMPHTWFLIAFGLMGAGDLYGVYFPNYVMSGSPADRVRHNIAYLQFMSLPVSVAPAALGVVSDLYGHRMAFAAAAFLLSAALLIIICLLPAQPQAK